MWKRALAVALTVLLAVSSYPVAALADESGTVVVSDGDVTVSDAITNDTDNTGATVTFPVPECACGDTPIADAGGVSEALVEAKVGATCYFNVWVDDAAADTFTSARLYVKQPNDSTDYHLVKSLEPAATFCSCEYRFSQVGAYAYLWILEWIHRLSGGDVEKRKASIAGDEVGVSLLDESAVLDPPAALSPTYTGSEVVGVAKLGHCTYTPAQPCVLDADGNAVAVEAGGYSIVARPDVGYVWADGMTNEDRTVSFQVSRASLTDAAIELETSSFTYDGTAHEPEPRVSMNGAQLVKDVDYTVRWENNVQPGAAMVTATGLGNYANSLSREFTIAEFTESVPPPAPVPARNLASKASVELSSRTFVYKARSVRPSVKVRFGTSVLAAGRDYSVTMPAVSKNVGVYKVTVNGKGVYKGSVSSSYAIVPKASAVKLLRAVRVAGAGSGVQLAWTKRTAQVSGYQISWSTAKSFKRAKTKRYKASSRAGKKGALTVRVPRSWYGKRVYVKVRTYRIAGGRTYTSSWSKARSVKVVG